MSVILVSSNLAELILRDSNLNLLPDPLRYRWPPHGRFSRTWRCFNGRAQEEVVERRKLVRRGRIRKNRSAINKGERIEAKEEPTESQKTI